MSRKSSTERSVNQRVGNAAREHKLIRVDAFAAYVMDRLLYRLGRSSQVDEFYLKGGVLGATLVDEPYRFTRDIDFLRRKGPPDPDEIRGRFEAVIAVAADDGIGFGKVRTVRAERDEDDYDGVKAFIAASIEGNDIDIRVDIGFGDAAEPPVERIRLTPFLPDDPPASLRAYPPGPVVAENTDGALEVAQYPSPAQGHPRHGGALRPARIRWSGAAHLPAGHLRPSGDPARHRATGRDGRRAPGPAMGAGLGRDGA